MRSPTTPNWPLIVIATLLAIAAAKLASDFIIPVVVGIFAAYALRPIVTTLTRARVPEPLAAATVMVSLLAAVAAGGYYLRDDVTEALSQLPQGVHQLRVKIRSLSTNAQPTPIQHVAAAAAELKEAAKEVAGAPPAVSRAPAAPAATDLVDRLTAHSFDVLGALSTLGVALTLTLFVLGAGDTFRRKLVRMVGTRLARKRVTVEILDEIDTQIQRFLLVSLLTNVVLGLVLWAAYAGAGLERAALWAALVAVLHVIPYLGIVLALALVAAVALLQFGSLGSVVAIVAVTLAGSTAIGVFLQNWLQGRSSRMNPVAVFVAVLFFGWLWGGWGLLLGAPLIAVVKTIADRIEALHPMGELLGS